MKLFEKVPLFLLLGAAASLAQPSYGSWTYSRAIKFNTTASGANVPGNVSNFPVLVRLDSTNFLFSQATGDGRDIRFEEAGHTFPLSYQIERWDSAGQAADIWVNVPQIDGNSGSDYIYMFWGNTGATDQSSGSGVFSSGFQGVWHLGDLADAAGNGSTLTNFGTVVNPGIAAGGRQFDGASQSLSIYNPAILNIASSITLSAWINPADWSGGDRRIIQKGATDNQYRLLDDLDSLKFDLTGVSGGSISFSPLPSTGSWHLVAGTYDGASIKLYIDGAQVASHAASGAIATSGDSLSLGKKPANAAAGNFFSGLMDEASISSSARSADWIKLSYANQKPNQNLLILGDKVWDGGGADNNWSTPANWSDDAVPTPGEGVLFDGTSNKTCVLDADESVRSIIIASGYTGSFDFSSHILSVAGNADLRSGGPIVAGAGTLEFSGLGTQKFFPKAGALHPSIRQSGPGTTLVLSGNLSLGNLDVTDGVFNASAEGRSLSASGNVAISGGTLSAANSPFSVGGNLTLSLGTLICPASGVSFTVAGSFTQSSGSSLNTNSGTLTLNGTAAGKALSPYQPLNNLVINGSGGSWAVAGTGLVANDLTLAAGTLDASANSPSIDAANLVINGGTLAAGGGSLHVTADFNMGGGALAAPGSGNTFSVAGSYSQTGGTFNAGNGTVTLGGASPGKILNATTAFHRLAITGAGGWTVTGNAFIADTLTLANGALNLGSSLTSLVGAGLGISGGGIDFGSSTLQVAAPVVDLHYLASVTAGTGTLEFTGASPQIFVTKSGSTLPRLRQNGAGGTTISTYGTIANAIEIISGALHLGTSINHDVGTFSASGGGLDFGSSILNLNGASADFSALDSMIVASGTLSFTGSSAQTFTPKAGMQFPPVRQSGSGTTTVAAHNLRATSLEINGGIFNLGSGLADSIGSLITTTGGLDFGTSLLHVTAGDADFSHLTSLTAGGGNTLYFESASGTQILTPKAAATHPVISHAAAGTLRLAGSLASFGFSQTAGSFDFNGYDLSTASAGNLTILNGDSASFLNLGGRTITVSGNASLRGQAAHHLGMKPAAAWNIAVTGSLNAVHADIMNSQATASAGSADSSQSLGGNVNWSFPDHIQPLDVTGLIASALPSGHGAVLTWVSSASADADSVMIRYRTDGAYPVSQSDGTLWRTLPNSATHDTALALPDKSIIHFAAFVRDTAGNWSNAAAGAQDTARTPDVTPPANVTALAATALGASSIALAWTASAASDAESLIVRYRTDGVYPTTQTDGVLWKAHVMSETADTATGLSEKTHYQFAAFVRDSSGNWSAAAGGARAASRTMDVTPPANVATLTAAALGASSVALSWTASVSADADSAMVRYRSDGVYPASRTDGTLWKTSAKAKTSDTVTGLAEKTAYRFGVFARDSSGNWSAAISGAQAGAQTLDGTPPANVTSFAATALGSSSIALAWTGSASTDAESVMVRYRTDGAYPASRTDGTLWKTGAMSLTADTATGLSEKTYYHFAAFVKDTAGNWSAAAAGARGNARTFDVTPPAGVTSLGAAALGAGAIALAWTPSSSADAESVLVRYRTDGVYPSNQSDGTLWKGLVASRSQDTITGLTEKSSLNVGLFVRDSAGNWSSAAAGARASATTADSGVPANVTAFHASLFNGTSVALSWTPSTAADAESVQVRYRTNGAFPSSHVDGTLWKSFVTAKTADTAAGLNEKTYYRFAAFVKDTSGNWSPLAAGARDSAKTADLTPPANVTALSLSALNSTSIALAWTPSASADADSLVIRYRTDGVYPTGPADGVLWKNLGAPKSKDTVTGLTEKALYHFALFTRDTAGNWSSSAAGAQGNIRTPDGTPPSNATAFTADAALPAWACADFGGPAAGSCAVSGGGTLLSLNGNAADLWGRLNQFTALYKRDVSGDFDVSIRVVSGSAIKKGIVAANDISDLGKGGFCTIKFIAGQGAYFETDLSAPQGDLETSARDSTTALSEPAYIRLTKTGGQFRGYVKQNLGDAWTQVGAAQTPMATGAISDVGIFVSPGTGGFGGASFDDYRESGAPAAMANATTAPWARLSWLPSASSDADSLMVRYRTNGAYPTGPADGALWKTYPASRTLDTAAGLLEKTVYNFAAFVKDSSGNWSAAAAAARDTVRTPDLTPPANVTGFTATALGPASVALSWTAPSSSDADSVRIRYQTGGTYLASASDGYAWKTWPRSRTKDTVTGLASNIVYNFGIFTRDSSGNYSASSASSHDTALYQAAVTGAVAFADTQGATRMTVPKLSFASSGADSLRFSLLADTGLAAWKPAHAQDSLSISPGGDGLKIVAAQFKNKFGTRSAWMRDTTRLDRVAPVLNVTLASVYNYLSWPGAFIGKAVDAVSGTDSVFVTQRRDADGRFFDGTGWGAAFTFRLRADSDFSAPLPAAALLSGDYTFTAEAVDKAGNLSSQLIWHTHYDENRTPALANSTVPDTTPQNFGIDWTVDFGDLDAGDSVKLVSKTGGSWLNMIPGQDSAYGNFAAHLVYRFTGAPGQASVGDDTLRLTVRDRGGLTYAYSKAFHVRDVNDAPVFDPGQDTLSITEDSLTHWTPKFKDADPLDTHVMTMVQGPSYATLNGKEIDFKPGSRDVGQALLILAVSDGNLSDTLKTTLAVLNVNDPPYAFPSLGYPSPGFWREDRLDTFTVVVVDMDRGDPVTLATALPSFIQVKASVDTVDGYNRFFKFSVLPREGDTASVNLALRFSDASGSYADLPLKGFIQSVNDPPQALVKGVQTQAGAARVFLDVQDADGSLDATRFHYRLLSSAGDTLRRGIGASPTLDLHPLADGDYHLQIFAEDQGGLKQRAPTGVDLHIAGATALALDSGRYYMLGTPGDPMPVSALGSGAVVTTWDETGDDGQLLARYSGGKAVDSLRRGKGYWVRLARPKTLNAGASLPQGPFAFKLTHAKQGWNQVANPFPYWIDLSATGLQFWEWDPDKRDLVNTRGLLKPWSAYWVMVARDTVLAVPDRPYFPQGAPLAKAASTSFLDQENWSMQLSLESGPYRDEFNFLGVGRKSAGAAAAAATPGAMPEPAKMGDYVALRFEKDASAGDSLGYATDYRPVLDSDEEWWDFAVENSATGRGEASLSLAGLRPLLASGLKVFLVRNGEAMAVDGDAPLALALGDKQSHYALVVTPHGDFPSRLKGGFNISQNFPNPVTDITSFRFVLPQTWQADGRRVQEAHRLRLDVYDFQGRLAARVAEGSYKAGSHILTWRPVSASGAPLARGPYLYRLQTPGFVKTLKMIVK